MAPSREPAPIAVTTFFVLNCTRSCTPKRACPTGAGGSSSAIGHGSRSSEVSLSAPAPSRGQTASIGAIRVLALAITMDRLVVRGARQHNLKNISLTLPRDRLVVITGPSGSGKSSLAFDTIYAEGQRRYVESLSAYARQFLEQLAKPDVEAIDGLSPAIAIEQRALAKSPRSTVGTVTEIADYLRLLFARVGTPHCPSCGKRIEAQTVQQIVDRILGLGEGTRASILAPIARARKGELKLEIEKLRREGFVRVRVDGEVVDLGDEIVLDRSKVHDLDGVIDRIAVREGVKSRLTDSVELALKRGEGRLLVDLSTETDKHEPLW